MINLYIYKNILIKIIIILSTSLFKCKKYISIEFKNKTMHIINVRKFKIGKYKRLSSWAYIHTALLQSFGILSSIMVLSLDSTYVLFLVLSWSSWIQLQVMTLYISSSLRSFKNLNGAPKYTDLFSIVDPVSTINVLSNLMNKDELRITYFASKINSFMLYLSVRSIFQIKFLKTLIASIAFAILISSEILISQAFEGSYNQS